VAKPWDVTGDAHINKRSIQRNLAWRRGQEVFAPQDVSHTHECIIDGVHKGIERLATSTHDYEVRCRASGEADFTPNQVIKTQITLWNPQA
jgi:hypothetical protein